LLPLIETISKHSKNVENELANPPFVEPKMVIPELPVFADPEENLRLEKKNQKIRKIIEDEKLEIEIIEADVTLMQSEIKQKRRELNLPSKIKLKIPVEVDEQIHIEIPYLNIPRILEGRF
jgi:hypothetical protein